MSQSYIVQLVGALVEALVGALVVVLERGSEEA